MNRYAGMGCIVALFFAAACTTAQFDGGADASTRQACSPTPVAYCDAMPLGEPGCVGDPNASNPSARRFPSDASFPLGCTANVLNPISDMAGDCTVAASCRCAAPEGDAGRAAPSWSCVP